MLYRRSAGDKALTDDLKLRIYPAVVGILGLCLVASLLSHFEVQIFTESAPLGDRANSTAVDLETGRSVGSKAVPSPSPAAVPSPVESIAPSAASGSSSSGDRVGSLRVSNPTIYPVRVALLPLDSAGAHSKQAGAGSNAQKGAIQPVHWDFAPDEGSVKGLKLSLPDGNLQVHSGDVLVAFAQDGSRQYWGPFVVGKTALPLWNPTVQEWQLRLQP